jgi:hypothetical protein
LHHRTIFPYVAQDFEECIYIYTSTPYTNQCGIPGHSGENDDVYSDETSTRKMVQMMLAPISACADGGHFDAGDT